MDVRPMTAGEWEAVAAIYAEGIATGNATFETAVPSWDDWDRNHTEDCRLVAIDGGAVIGWAALVPYSRRRVYRGVGEVQIYVAGAARGRGVGRRLLAALIVDSERAGYWTLQAGILPENQASLAMHLAAGFREVGRRERIGATTAGVWRDVILLERRSAVVGVSDF